MLLGSKTKPKYTNMTEIYWESYSNSRHGLIIQLESDTILVWFRRSTTTKVGFVQLWVKSKNTKRTSTQVIKCVKLSQRSHKNLERRQKLSDIKSHSIIWTCQTRPKPLTTRYQLEHWTKLPGQILVGSATYHSQAVEGDLPWLGWKCHPASYQCADECRLCQWPATHHLKIQHIFN